MIAVSVHAGVVLAGIDIPPHRTLEVVDDVVPSSDDGQRRVLSAPQARALVQAGCADPIEADFDELHASMDRWQRA